MEDVLFVFEMSAVFGARFEFFGAGLSCCFGWFPFFVCCPQRKTLYFGEALSERLLLAHAVQCMFKKID